MNMSKTEVMLSPHIPSFPVLVNDNSAQQWKNQNCLSDLSYFLHLPSNTI